MQTASTDRSIFSRMVRAARVDSAVYEEVEHDRDATMQAALVVLGTSIAAGIGGGVALGIGGFVAVIIAGILGWAFYAWITYLVGVHLLAGEETRADWGEVARGLGFAVSPRALLILGVIPALAGIIGLIVTVWILFTTVVALRAALDFSTPRAIATAIIGWLAQALIIAASYALAA